MCMTCLISNITDVCILSPHPIVRIPTADRESEKSMIVLISLFFISNVVLSSVILMSISSPRRMDGLSETVCDNQSKREDNDKPA